MSKVSTCILYCRVSDDDVVAHNSEQLSTAPGATYLAVLTSHFEDLVKNNRSDKRDYWLICVVMATFGESPGRTVLMSPSSPPLGNGARMRFFCPGYVGTLLPLPVA